MENDNKNRDRNYDLRFARNLIYLSYKNAGFDYAVESFEQSTISKYFGGVPEGWNKGLFRYLDESINLINTAEIALLSALMARGDGGKPTHVVLIAQIKNNLSAIRALSHMGLDGQARLTLRALYENSIALCRSLIDNEFSEEFKSVKNSDEANQFWHKYLSRSKSENYIIDYNSKTDKKCPLLIGNIFKEIYKILGVSAHPNYIFSQFDFIDAFSLKERSDNFLPGSEKITEFVLTSAIHINLSVISFLSILSDDIFGETEWIIKEGQFKKNIKQTMLY